MLWINNIALTGQEQQEKNQYWNILTLCNRRSRLLLFRRTYFLTLLSFFDPSLQETQDFTDLESYFTFKINYWKSYLPFNLFDIKISILSFSLTLLLLYSCRGKDESIMLWLECLQSSAFCVILNYQKASNDDVSCSTMDSRFYKSKLRFWKSRNDRS